ncbi:hypothetical protein PHYBOEH_003615 [Phytophthora boehmeriae]|uniref:Uncharacterized protein n=1 Tax=Phytophthora boehmeriae TaxID=109152 RepID=A0A8T1WUK7_9STRA|nr:hypothetical protein PHYBOEH_003615 [Phytophthora boehmeriae]
MSSTPDNDIRHPTTASDGASANEGDVEAPATNSQGKRKFVHTTKEQTESLLEWLEQPENFELLTRPSAESLSTPATAATGASPPQKRLKKIDGYRALAQHMNQMTDAQWTEKKARSRYESFMGGYHKALRQNPLSLKPAYQRLDAMFKSSGRRDRSGSNVSRGSNTSREGGTTTLSAREMNFLEAVTTTSTPELTRVLQGGLRDRSGSNISRDGSTAVLPSRDRDSRTETLVLEHSLMPPMTELTRVMHSEQQTSTPPRRRERLPSMFESATSTPRSDGGAEESSVSTAIRDGSVPSTLNEQVIRLESQRLAVRQQELVLKQNELLTRQQESRQTLRAEVLTRLVEAGKSPAEVREYLKIMDTDPASNQTN